MSRSGAWLAAMLTLAGCDPLMGVTGVVKNAPSCGPGTGGVYASSGPVVGAAVHLSCPSIEGGGGNRELAKTDERGRFSYGAVGLWSSDCDIVVDKPGYAPERFRVGDLCAVPNGDSACHVLAIHADLKPIPKP